jgi:acyl-CoA synthetase (AMP-forming)/AMP-acid ligase II/acyl carrier protein
METQDIFSDLLTLLGESRVHVDLDAITLDDQPFSVHGIDSMAMLNLVGAVETKFDITIDDSDAMIAFSFERLTRLIQEKASTQRPSEQPVAQGYLARVEESARAAGARATLRVLDRAGSYELTYEEFLRTAAWLGERLPAATPGRPQTVVIAGTDPLPILLAFFAALGRQARPLILPTPKSLGGMADYAARVDRLASAFGGDCVLALQDGTVPDPSILPQLPILRLFSDPASFGKVDQLPPAAARTAAPDDIAFLQMSSASTGDGKLIAISNRNVCTNLSEMHVGLGLNGPDERTFSWLPLYHDMGLLGGALYPLLMGFSTVIMKPTDFIRNPARWIRGVSEYRCSFTGAPNFALDYAALAIQDADLEGVDLSCLRRVGVAAEPINRGAVQKFVNRFAAYGFRPDSLVPGLGLAESTLATTTRPGKDPRFVIVESGGAVVGQPVAIVGEGFIRHPEEAPTGDDSRGVSIFSLGTPMAGLTVGLADDEGQPIRQEGVLGEITVSGSSICAGYYDAPAERAVPIDNGLLLTGDLGFFHREELFVMERRKNVIIRRGANFLASLLEQRVATILGISPFATLVLEADLHLPDSDIQVLIEQAQDLPEPTPAQRQELRALELPIDVVIFARGFAIPRTTSGKKRYHVARQDLAAGELDVVRSFDLRGSA